MTIPGEYGGGGLGITSYNRVLERIGRILRLNRRHGLRTNRSAAKRSCSTAPKSKSPAGCPISRRIGSAPFAFPSRMSVATRAARKRDCELSADGEYYILNGEKKWSTSGALSGLFTVMARQKLADPKDRETTGKDHRPRLHTRHGRHRHLPEKPLQMRHPRHLAGPNPLHTSRSQEPSTSSGRQGLKRRPVLPQLRALHALGRHAAARAGLCPIHQGPRRDFNFSAPLADFELVQAKIAHMSAHLRHGRGPLHDHRDADRHDEDIMLETAICKALLLGNGLAGGQRCDADHGRRRVHDRKRDRANLPRFTHQSHRRSRQ